jgi:hypothetical protein
MKNKSKRKSQKAKVQKNAERETEHWTVEDQKQNLLAPLTLNRRF